MVHRTFPSTAPLLLTFGASIVVMLVFANQLNHGDIGGVIGNAQKHQKQRRTQSEVIVDLTGWIYCMMSGFLTVDQSGLCEENVVTQNIIPTVSNLIIPNTTIYRADMLVLAGYEGDNERLTQDYLIDELIGMGAIGLNTAGRERESFKQAIDSSFPRTNIVAVLPGRVLPDEYIVLGAHINSRSCDSIPGSVSGVCNRATDNAASAAIVLAIGRALSAMEESPERSVALCFWDDADDEIFGSDYFVKHDSLIPTDQIIAVLDYHIQGSNQARSLRSFSYATGAESGGDQLSFAVARAALGENLNLLFLSQSLGPGGSSLQSFANAGVPTVIFTDSYNGCYNTTSDELKIVDFDKLENQARIAIKLTYDLARREQTFDTSVDSIVPVTFNDAVALNSMVNTFMASDDAKTMFSTEYQGFIQNLQQELNTIVDSGAITFVMDVMSHGESSPFSQVVRGLVFMFKGTDCVGFLDE